MQLTYKMVAKALVQSHRKECILAYALSEVIFIILVKLVIHYLRLEQIENVNIHRRYLLNVQISARMKLLCTLAF